MLFQWEVIELGFSLSASFSASWRLEQLVLPVLLHTSASVRRIDMRKNTTGKVEECIDCTAQGSHGDNNKKRESKSEIEATATATAAASWK